MAKMTSNRKIYNLKPAIKCKRYGVLLPCAKTLSMHLLFMVFNFFQPKYVLHTM